MRYSLGNSSDVPIAARASTRLGGALSRALPFVLTGIAVYVATLWISRRRLSQEDFAVAFLAGFFSIAISFLWGFLGRRALRRQQAWHATLPFMIAGYTFAIARGQNIFLTFDGDVRKASAALKNVFPDAGVKGIAIHEIDEGQLRLKLTGSPRAKVKRIQKLLTRVLLPLHTTWPLKSIDF